MGDLITPRFPLDEIEKAFKAQLGAGKSLKVMILPNSGKG